MKDWAKFVFPKTNAAAVLAKQMKRARGSVYVSSVTDAYHPLEEKYKLTRRCRLKYFMDCLEKREHPDIAGGKVARDALEVVLLAKESLETG